MSDTTTQRFTVEGMTCGHCVGAVRDELSQLPGVRDVQVDLDSGAVSVASDAPLTEADLAAAVDEAGYRISGAVR
jgi:copper chaperone CopZ